MAPRLCVFTVFLIHILISSAQSSLQQYLHITGLAQNAKSAGHNPPNVGYSRHIPNGLTSIPNGGLANLASLASGLTSLTSGLQSNAGMTVLPNNGLTGNPNSGMAAMPKSGMSNVPNAELSALGALASIPGLLQALTSTTASSQAQPATTSTGIPTLKTKSFQSSCSASSVPTSKQNSSPATAGGLDSGVLNNLAIALQLLIVSNILNSNLPENEANPIYELLETAKMIPVSFSQTETPPQTNAASSSKSSSNLSSDLQTFEELIQQYSVPSRPPNANFLGSSEFTGFSVSDPYIKPSSKSSFQLMSPYEALGPNSQFSDPIISSAYGSVMSSKRDFQSPYIMMDSDPFANDLFS